MRRFTRPIVMITGYQFNTAVAVTLGKGIRKLSKISGICRGWKRKEEEKGAT